MGYEQTAAEKQFQMEAHDADRGGVLEQKRKREIRIATNKFFYIPYLIFFIILHQ